MPTTTQHVVLIYCHYPDGRPRDLIAVVERTNGRTEDDILRAWLTAHGHSASDLAPYSTESAPVTPWRSVLEANTPIHELPNDHPLYQTRVG